MLKPNYYIYQSPLINVIISGGEPTTHKHILDILVFATSLFPSVNLATNGIRLSDYSFAKSVISTGINDIAIPFYHTEEETFNYLVQNQHAQEAVNSALKNIKLLKSKYNFRINLKILITKINYTNNPDIVTYLENIIPELDSITLAFLRVSEKVLKNKGVTVDVAEAKPYNTETLNRILALGHEFKPDHIPLCGIDSELICKLISQRKIYSNNKISTVISPNGVLEKLIIEGYAMPKCVNCKLQEYCPKFPKKNATEIDYDNQVSPYF